MGITNSLLWNEAAAHGSGKKKLGPEVEYLTPVSAFVENRIAAPGDAYEYPPLKKADYVTRNRRMGSETDHRRG